MDYSKLQTSLYIAACFEMADGEESLADVLAANSPTALSDLVKRVESMHGRFHHIKFRRDMPHYRGVAHRKLAGEFCA